MNLHRTMTDEDKRSDEFEEDLNERKPHRSVNDIGNYRERPWYDKNKLYRVLFFTDTKEGWTFELILLCGILLSTIVVFLDSLGNFTRVALTVLRTIQWIWTIFTAIEYVFRLYASRKVGKFALSFYGIVDLLSFLPSLLTASVVGAHYTLIFRMLRILRIFRVFHMGDFMRQGRAVARALRQSYTKVVIFILWLVVIVCVLGTVMFLVEGSLNPMFSSIPRAIYWAIITLTTVGYGDITPITGLGQFISTVVMLLGYSIIAVPTGIVTAEVSRVSYAQSGREKREKTEMDLSDLSKKGTPSADTKGDIFCYSCGYQNRDPHANYCCNCGTKLYKEEKEKDKDTPAL